MIRLEVKKGQATGKVFESTADLVRVGRAEGNDVIVGDDLVSGEHAQFFFDGEKYLVRDQRSTNGTWVVRGETRIAVDDAALREVPLADGDVVELGTADGMVALGVTLKVDENPARVVAMRKI